MVEICNHYELSATKEEKSYIKIPYLVIGFSMNIAMAIAIHTIIVFILGTKPPLLSPL